VHVQVYKVVEAAIMANLGILWWSRNSSMPWKTKLCWYRFCQAMESHSAIVGCLPHEYDGTVRKAGPIVVFMSPWRHWCQQKHWFPVLMASWC